MQASGIGLRRLLIPVGLFSFGVYTAAFALSLWAQPWSGASLKTLALDMITEQLQLPLDEGVFNDPCRWPYDLYLACRCNTPRNIHCGF